jgi:hypothetical protein
MHEELENFERNQL